MQNTKFGSVPLIVGVLLVAAGCGSAQPGANLMIEGGGGPESGGGPTNDTAGASGASGASMAGAATAAAGADSPPAHVVTACPSAGQGVGVGVWEEITPPDVQKNPGFGGTQAVVVDPHNPATVYMAGSGLSGGAGGIFKSLDCGATWNKVNTGKELDGSAPWSMVIDPINPDTLYAVAGYGANGLWKTTDGGVSWTQLYTKGSLVEQTAVGNFASIISMDPTNHLHLVVSFHSGCTGDVAPNCLAETVDGGTNWSLLKGPSDGGEGSGPIVLNMTTWLYAVPFGGLFLTQDSGATWSKVADGSHYELYHSKSGTYYLGSIHGVLKSSDGLVWDSIPDSGGQEQGIIGDGKTLYVSQQNGTQYYTASEDNPVTWTNHTVPGANGAYWMAYDEDHHILYQTAGKLWRMVTY